MIPKIVNLKTLLFSAAMFLAPTSLAIAQSVPSPKEVYGFSVGDDYQLADYTQIEDYLAKLDNASSRVKKIEIGETVLGRKMYLLFISSEENLAQLAGFSRPARCRKRRSTIRRRKTALARRARDLCCATHERTTPSS